MFGFSLRNLWSSLKLVVGMAVFALPLIMSGCMDLTGRGPALLDRTKESQRQHPLAGHVYCMRGFLGIFSTGMDDLAREIDKEVVAVSVADEEWHTLRSFLIDEYRAGRLNEPIVLVGHSWGADDQIRVAERLNHFGITVDLLITVDPVTPPAIPPNVKRCVNVYKSHPLTDVIPLWRGVEIPVHTTMVPVTNIDLRIMNVGFATDGIDHINIEKSEGVHKLVMAEIRKVCPPRETYYRLRESDVPVVGLSPTESKGAVSGPEPAGKVGTP